MKGYKRKTQVDVETMKATLRELISQSNGTIYTVMVSKKNSPNVVNRFVSVFLVVDGDMVNISLFTAKVIEVESKRLLSDYLVVTEIEEAGYFIKRRLQAELNRGVFMKVDLKQEWR